MHCTTQPFVPDTHSPVTRQAWANQASSKLPFQLSGNDLEPLKGINENLSLEEVTTIYWPLVCLLNTEISAYWHHQAVCTQSIGQQTPYIIGIAGSVAAGKSTSARVLQALLKLWPKARRVDLVTTDGFLYPNHILRTRNLMQKKGFPHAYDTARLMQFVVDLKAGKTALSVPIYCHRRYDIVPKQQQHLQQPEIVILEGLNVLQSQTDYPNTSHRRFIADFIDFSIYIDATELLLKQWYIERFLTLRQSAFLDPQAYFHHYAQLPEAEAIATAAALWDSINSINLQHNILPTRQRARLILTKGSDHLVKQVYLQQ